MVPVKRKLTNKSFADKCKVLKDLENGKSNRDVTAANDVTSASYMSDADIHTEVIPDSIENQDGDVIEDLDFSPPLTRPSKSDVEEVLDNLQDLSLFSSYGNEIRSLILKIETFLNKARTDP